MSNRSVGVAGRIAAALLLAIGLVAGPGAARAASVDPAASSTALEASDALLEDDGSGREHEGGIRDPIEPINRGVFAGNRAIDRTVFDPIAQFYGWALPDPAKRAIRRVFDNLNLPVVIVNDLLQLEMRRAGEATGRFLLNSTFGIAGLFDPALEAGLEPHHADFGQTLGRAGVGPGFYLVLPLLGPTTARDAVGSIFDVALRPDTWLLPVGPRLLLGGTWGITEREHHQEGLEALESTSVDFYSAVRTAYWLNRAAVVRGDGGPPPRGEGLTSAGAFAEAGWPGASE